MLVYNITEARYFIILHLNLNFESKMGAVDNISPINLRFYSSQDCLYPNVASIL